MLSKNDLVLLKAVFNPKLHDAVLAGDKTLVEAIIKEEYSGEYFEDTVLNMEFVQSEHLKELEADDFRWALY